MLINCEICNLSQDTMSLLKLTYRIIITLIFDFYWKEKNNQSLKIKRKETKGEKWNISR